MPLASLYFEPVWVFVRGAASPRRLVELTGRHIAAGIEGSGTRVLALELLTASGVFERSTTMVDIGSAAAIAAPLEQRVDAAVFVTARPMPALSPLKEGEGDSARRFRARRGLQVPLSLSGQRHPSPGR